MAHTFSGLVLCALSACSMSVPAVNVSIQVVNSADNTPIRVSLDRKVIYEATATAAKRGVHGATSEVAGSFDISGPGPHILVAEVPGSPVKAQLEWVPAHTQSDWVVVRYYGGRPEPFEPPFFTLSLQRSKFMLK